MSTTTKAVVRGPFRSLPLPRTSKCIRVLDVYGSSLPHREEGRIVGRLRVIDLDQGPPFAALSYVWGPKSSTPKTINCGNCAIPITDNGYSALQHLQQALGAFTIWIDAICIDQEAEIEKQHQITLMGRIFSESAKVYVWLGEANGRTNRAMQYLAGAGFLEHFLVNGGPEEAEYSQPRSWAAFWSCYSARFSFKRRPIPYDEDGIVHPCPER